MKLPIEIDRRQRLVAALMVMGFDLPQDLKASAEAMQVAADLCPGLTVDEIPMRGARNRRLVLLRARTLIDEMLEDEEKATT